MKYNNKNINCKKMLVQRLAFVIAVCYLLGPFQQHLSNILHSISHDLGLPDYVITHTEGGINDDIYAHSYGDHRTADTIHEHQIVDFVQELLTDSAEQGQNTDPELPRKSVDKHLIILNYNLAKKCFPETKELIAAQEQNVLTGHPRLWLEPPIYLHS